MQTLPASIKKPAPVASKTTLSRTVVWVGHGWPFGKAVKNPPLPQVGDAPF